VPIPVPEMTTAETDRVTWRNTWRWIVGLAACGALGWWAFVRDARVPLLSLVNLGFHELGHLLTYWLPSVVTAMMGSINQVLVPLLLAGYFLWGNRDRLAAALCLAWAATNAQEAAVYIADAPFQQLPLIGGHHDWGFVLGPQHFDALDRAGLIAACVRGFGVALWLASLSICLAGLLGFLSDPPPRLRSTGGGAHGASDHGGGDPGDWGVLDVGRGSGPGLGTGRG
jgi:hypothetical protein